MNDTCSDATLTLLGDEDLAEFNGGEVGAVTAAIRASFADGFGTGFDMSGFDVGGMVSALMANNLY